MNFTRRHPRLHRILLMLASPLLIVAAKAQEPSWTQTSLHTDDQVTAVAVQGSSVVAGTASKGIFHSTDGGATWSQATPTFAGVQVRALWLDASDAVLAGTDNGAFKSTDGGATWADMGAGLSGLGRSIEGFDGMHGFVIAATDDGVYLFSSTQQEWAPVGLQGSQVMAVALDGVGGVAAAALPDKLYHMSQSTPEQWTQSTTRATGLLTMTSSGDGKLFAASSDLYVSSDHGTSWQQTSYSSTIIFTIVRNGTSGLLIGDLDGVTASTDNGSTWKPMRGTNAPEGVMSIAVGDDGRIYAGTLGGDLYISSESSSSVATDAATTGSAGITLGGIYPNPARDRMTIPFTLSHRTGARITLCDPLGRVVAGKEIESLDAGARTIELDIASCPSGVYLCTLDADGARRTAVVTVVR